MPSDATLVPRATGSEREQIYGIVIVMAASLIALTVLESAVTLTVKSGVATPVKLLLVRFSELGFIPAAIWVGWASRSLGLGRFLPVLGAFASSYFVLTQSRGSWIWHGTFDQADYSRWPWLRDGLLGIILALVVGAMPAKTLPEETSVVRFLVGLALSLVAAGLIPKLLPADSEFAPTRWIFLAVFFLCLVVVFFVAQKVSEVWAT